MLRSQVSRTLHTCLRCQYRLAVRTRLFQLRQQPPQQRRWFYPDRLSHQENLTQGVPPLDGIHLYNGLDKPYGAYDGPNISYEPFDGPVIRYEHHGGPTPEQKQALKHALGVNVLGKPADVFVFEPEQEKKKVHEFEASAQQRVDGEYDLDEAEILKRISDGTGIVDIEDACAHIDEIRQSWEKERLADSSFVTERQYKELHEKLYKGFTKVQLQSYVDREMKEKSTEESDLSQEFVGTFYTRSSWDRGETSIKATRAPPLAINGEEHRTPHTTARLSATPKEEVAGSILDDVWQVAPPSRDHEIGELEIRVARIPFQLIMQHRSTFFKTISEQYGVKIEALPHSRVVRVTSTRDVCGDIFRLVKYKVLGVEKQRWVIDAPDSMQFRPRIRKAIAAETAKISNTVLDFVPSHNGRPAFDLHYLPSQANDYATATAFLQASLQRVGDHNLDCFWSYRIFSNRLASSLIDVGSRMPYFDRDEQWFRWVYPSPMLLHPDHKNPAMAPFASASRHGSFLGRNYLIEKTSKFFDLGRLSLPNFSSARNHWDGDVMIEREVKYGQIITPMSSTSQLRSLVAGNLKVTPPGDLASNVGTEETGTAVNVADSTNSLEMAEKRADASTTTTSVASNQAAKPDQRPTEDGSKAERNVSLKRITRALEKSERVFLPLASGVLAKMDIIKSDTSRSEDVIITLHPRSTRTVPRSLLKHLPVLKLRVTSDLADRTMKLISARLIVEKKSLGVLSPGQHTDLLATYQAYLETKGQAIDPGLHRFVRDSQLDIWGERKLTTPNEFYLRVPTSAIKTTKLGHDTDVGKAAITAGDNLRVLYTFTSLEIVSSIRTIYGSRNQLQYNAVEDVSHPSSHPNNEHHSSSSSYRRDETVLSCVTSLPIEKFSIYTNPAIQTPAARKIRSFQQGLSTDLIESSMDFLATVEDPTRQSEIHAKAAKKQEEAKRSKRDKIIRQAKERMKFSGAMEEFENLPKLEESRLLQRKDKVIASEGEVEEDSGAIKAIQDMFNAKRAAQRSQAQESNVIDVEPKNSEDFDKPAVQKFNKHDFGTEFEELTPPRKISKVRKREELKEPAKVARRVISKR